VEEALTGKGEAANDATNNLLNLFALATGQLAKLQMQEIIGAQLGADTPISQMIFEQMGLLTLLSGTLSTAGIAAEIASLGQIDQVTQEVRRFLGDSGVTQLTQFGYGQILAEVLGEPMSQELRVKTAHALIGLNDLVTLQFRREGFDPDNPAWSADLLEQVRRYGLSEERANLLLKAYVFYPAVQDWLRFSVREVFREDVVSEWGYDDQFPEAILEHTRKAGLRDEIVKWFWRAHWELPSPNMGYEMLHRGQITQEQLKGLLKIADYAPGWIEKMIAISYQPITRIDLRRMYLSKTIGRERFRRGMMDLGYSPDDAALFTQWVDEELGASQKDLSLSQVRQEHDLGLIADAEYLQELTRHGYDEQEAGRIIALDTAKAKRSLQTEAIKIARSRYKYALSSLAELRAELTKAGVREEKIASIVSLSETERTQHRKLPSKADLTDWLKKGVISEDIFLARLKSLGYTPDDARLYLQAAGLGATPIEE
jgi:hypothetical protein